MQYLYILQSLAGPDRHYTGCTQDLRERMAKHNAGEVPPTLKFAPWRVATDVAFSDEGARFRFRELFEIGLG